MAGGWLTPPTFRIWQVGAAIVSTTSDMAPADRKMYALRDVTKQAPHTVHTHAVHLPLGALLSRCAPCVAQVTGTVPSIPLITASIMCKKLAENPGVWSTSRYL